MNLGVTTLGRQGVNAIDEVGGMAILFGRFLVALSGLPRSFRLYVEQVYSLGVRSLPLIVIISVFVGAVSAWQGAYQFSFIGAPLRFLGQAVGKAVVIELAPVLTALVMTGKVGAAIAAEIGSMRVSEQLDALSSMSVEPEEFLYLPRIAAGVVAFPLLTIFANVVGIGSAWFFNWLRNGIHYHTFFNNIRSYFQTFDLLSGIVKAIVFGFVITSLACFFGDRTRGGAEGVGRSTMLTVVYSAVWVLVMDFIVAFVILGSV